MGQNISPPNSILYFLDWDAFYSCQRQFGKLKHSYMHLNWPMQICKTNFNFEYLDKRTETSLILLKIRPFIFVFLFDVIEKNF